MEDYNLQKSLGFKLELASRLTTGNFSKKLKEDKFLITPEQWGVINFLLHEDGLTQNQISKLVGKDHTCVSRLIENLIKKNIVKKIPDPDDKRINLIYLTEEGKKIQNNVVPTVKENLHKVFFNVTDEEKIIFSKVLDKIIKNLE
ncbi:MarR family winged helix-turn-helix transcriptional regulator [Fusobacterium sp.]|uniref:MarR family winged helix-turn-helix transcriptional regulator n=1 Tax=Fusobacterium sp. TaxID=68766 RepID=UPI0028FFF169|nr:MarR family winged helix-turn-helix transcriptional regulator [Fusobacterium sp.]MDU1909934.1 MarR family winged helix-turn-helix transcriptional regulator [Fusobacterium sp.]